MEFDILFIISLVNLKKKPRSLFSFQNPCSILVKFDN